MLHQAAHSCKACVAAAVVAAEHKACTAYLLVIFGIVLVHMLLFLLQQHHFLTCQLVQALLNIELTFGALQHLPMVLRHSLWLLQSRSENLHVQNQGQRRMREFRVIADGLVLKLMVLATVVLSGQTSCSQKLSIT